MKNLLPILLFPVFALLPSCRAFQNLIHDEEAVARLGTHKLYRSDLDRMIPAGTVPEDSANLAMRYIHSWAKDMAFLDVAEQQLSKEEKDVTGELEAYRQSLLRYRYEQRFVNERLDTTVSGKQVEDYYGSHPESFRLDRPVFKTRFLRIAKDSPNLPVIRKLMSSDKVEDVVAADSVAFNSAKRYVDYSWKWIDAVTLAAEFGVDFSRMLSQQKGKFIEMTGEDGDVSVAYVVDMVGAGQTAPVEFVRERIRDIILSGRKHALLTTLEQDLIEDAEVKGKFEIYPK